MLVGGADVEEKGGLTESNPLHEAARVGNKEMLKSCAGTFSVDLACHPNARGGQKIIEGCKSPILGTKNKF